MKPHFTKSNGHGWWLIAEHRGPNAARWLAGPTLLEAIAFVMSRGIAPSVYCHIGNGRSTEFRQ
jgi:hypothetical protein